MGGGRRGYKKIQYLTYKVPPPLYNHIRRKPPSGGGVII